jgi:hypothetical protein
MVDMSQAAVRTLPQTQHDNTLDTATYPRRYVEFWRMMGQKYNPKDRTSKRRQQNKELRASIKDHGIIQPLVLTSDYEKIDGHVRSDIGQELGLAGANCLIAPFDSSDPRADLLYKLINQRVVMTPAQKLEAHAKGAIAANATTAADWRDAVKMLGDSGTDTGHYLELFRSHGYKPQLLKNCRAVAVLVFNNGILEDRKARESFVWRKVMQWQCQGNRQGDLKIYCTKAGNGKPGFTARKLWNAIEKNQDIES